MLRLLILIFFALSAHANEPLIIALDADLSAVAAEGGIAISRGAEIAIDEINERGGVLGRPLKLQRFDHRGNPARGIANVKRIAKLDNVVAVLGGVHTPVAMQELPLLHEHKLIYLDPWAAGTPIVDNGFNPNYVFRVSVRDAEAGKVLIKAAKQHQTKRVALLLEQTAWGRSNQSSLVRAADSQGIEVATIQWFNWGQKDFRDEISQIAEQAVDAIVFVGNAPEGAQAIKALSMNNETSKLPIYSHWGLAGGAFVEKVGIDTLQKIELFVLQTFSFMQAEDESINQRLLNSYRSKYVPDIAPEAIPGAVGVAHAYDLIHIFAKAISLANSTDRAKIRDALEQVQEHRGLVKHYRPPFSPEQHDALWADDYIISQYNELGYLVPLGE